MRTRILAFVALLCFGATAYAQDSSIIGTAIDDTKAVLPGVSVTATDRCEELAAGSAVWVAADRWTVNTLHPSARMIGEGLLITSPLSLFRIDTERRQTAHRGDVMIVRRPFTMPPSFRRGLFHREHPDRAAFGHVRKVSRRRRVQPRLHAARVDAPS